MNLSRDPYFIVGIKGMAMANIAVILRSMGIEVTGSDTPDTQPTDTLLQQHGISWTEGFDPSDLPQNTHNVIYAASHKGIKNPQVKEAQRRELSVIHQATLLGKLMADFDESLAVCGCHGKTTTSSLLAFALSHLKASPSWLVGAPSFNEYWGGAYEGQAYFVIEADEYAIDPPHDRTPKLLSLHPDYALCLNIDFDHPDVYKNLDATKDTFQAFFHQTNKKVIGCGEDGNTMDVLQSTPKEKYVSYGFDPRHDLVLSEIRYEELSSSFRVTYEGHDRGVFTTSLFGEKNVLNAGGVILLLFELGFTSDQVRDAVRYFTGAKRRFEFIANENGIYLFDDYGHHPHELEALIQAARTRFPEKRIILIFQPHTYTRTAQMKGEFADVLSNSDLTLLPPIFGSAREEIQEAVSSHDIVQAAQDVGTHTIHAFDTNDDMLNTLKKELKTGDVVFTVGAGDVYKMGDAVIEIMKQVQ
jgi:UDP-N-acetylmuramate--alanine ligase